MYIGIDLGGTKTEIICLDDRGEELYRHRVLSPRDNYQNTLLTIKSLINIAEDKLGKTGTVGIGIPGSICRQTHTVINSNSTWINGQPLQKDLEKILERDICVENDANCFALSEARDGIASNRDIVFGVIIGTGCGGGVVIDGKIKSGLHGTGGEWGHNPLPFPKLFGGIPEDLLQHFSHGKTTRQSSIYQNKSDIDYGVSTIEENEYPGPLCYCGKRGCIETWISGTGFLNDYQRNYAQGNMGSDVLSAESIIALAANGDANAMATLYRYCERVAKSLAQIINIIDPDVIVLGGGMSNVNLIYKEVPKRWDKYIFSTQSNTELLKAKHGDSSGVRGAAMLWENRDKR